MKCERSVITMTLHWHSSQVSNLNNCVDDTLIETDLKCSANSSELTWKEHFSFCFGPNGTFQSLEKVPSF